MLVKVEDRTYKVNWKYDGLGFFTDCMIYDFTNPQDSVEPKEVKPLALGFAECSLFDNFNKNVGRKISFGRALAQLFPTDKETRALFWQEYYKMRNNRW